jgi:hypothetical protein
VELGIDQLGSSTQKVVPAVWTLTSRAKSLS